MKEKKLYTSIAESSYGKITFTEHLADLFTESYQLLIRSKGSEVDFSLYGWGNIPGVQELSSSCASTRGGYLMFKQQGSIYCVEDGIFEVCHFDSKEMYIDIRYCFRMAEINSVEPVESRQWLHLEGEMQNIEILPVLCQVQ